MTVSNGSRVPVSFPDYEGTAGLMVSEDTALLSHPSPSAPRLTAGFRLAIDDVLWEVTAVRRSQIMRTYRVVHLQRVG